MYTYVRKWKFIITLLFADDKHLFQSVVLGFCREVDENCALKYYYATSSGNYLSTFRDNLSVPYLGVKIPEERISFVYFKLKPEIVKNVQDLNKIGGLYNLKISVHKTKSPVK